MKEYEQLQHTTTLAMSKRSDKGGARRDGARRSSLKLGQRVQIESASATYNGLFGTVTAVRRRLGSQVYVVALERLIESGEGRILEVVALTDQLRAI